MLELLTTPASIVTAVASLEAIDAAMGAPGTYRVAPDELMAIGAAEDAIAATIAAVDPDALVVDASDGWSLWSLRGDDARSAFAYVSALELPAEGFVQGDVAHVPVRVVVGEERVDLFVPSMWGAYLHQRLLERCRVLQIREPPEQASP